MLQEISLFHACSTTEVVMRLTCRKCCPLVFALALSCDEATGPPPPISALYFLESVNGDPLPALIQHGGGATTTIFSSTLRFDGSGNAAITEFRRGTALGSPTIEGTFTSTYSYRVLGDSIAFDKKPRCPDNAICVAPPGARLSDSRLTLLYSGRPPVRPPLFYRPVGSE